MKACMLAYTFYESDTRVISYAEELASLGWEVDAICLKKEKQRNFEILNGVKVYRIQERKINEKNKITYLKRILIFFIRSLFFLSKLHGKKKYDIIHVHSVPDFEIFAAIVPKLTGAKLILDIHDIVPEFYMAKFPSSNRFLLYNLLIIIEKLSTKFADHVIISNHIWEKRLIKRSVPKNKVTTILNYPSRFWFNSYKRTRDDKKFIIVYPGSLNWHQGLDIAIDAISLVREKVNEIEFHIYGEGPSKPFLIKQVKDLHLEDVVKFFRPRPSIEVPSIMANADLGIIPKRNDKFGGEAFSTKTLEFMSVGVPIILSKTKIDSYYFNNSVVRFFEPGNVNDLATAILEMINNKTLRKQLAKNAFKFAQKFSWENNRQIYLDIVYSLVYSRKFKNQYKKNRPLFPN